MWEVKTDNTTPNYVWELDELLKDKTIFPEHLAGGGGGAREEKGENKERLQATHLCTSDNHFSHQLSEKC